MKKSFLKKDRRITINDLSKSTIDKFNNKTRALKVQFIKPSKTNKGYFKYEITFIENGEVKYRPVYGVDMQDAIKRFVLSYKYDKFSNKISNRKKYVAYGLVIGIISSTSLLSIFLKSSFMWVALLPFGLGVVVMILLDIIETRIEKSK